MIDDLELQNKFAYIGMQLTGLEKALLAIAGPPDRLRWVCPPQLFDQILVALASWQHIGSPHLDTELLRTRTAELLQRVAQDRGELDDLLLYFAALRRELGK